MIACKRRARHLALELASDLALIDESLIKRLMPKIRRDLADLNQSVHEFNAYRNVIETK